MIWFFWLTICLSNHKKIELKYGNFASQAVCEQTLKTLKLNSTKDTITSFVGGCMNESELERIKRRSK